MKVTWSVGEVWKHSILSDISTPVSLLLFHIHEVRTDNLHTVYSRNVWLLVWSILEWVVLTLIWSLDPGVKVICFFFVTLCVQSNMCFIQTGETESSRHIVCDCISKPLSVVCVVTFLSFGWFYYALLFSIQYECTNVSKKCLHCSVRFGAYIMLFLCLMQNLHLSCCLQSRDIHDMSSKNYKRVDITN